MTDYNDDKSCLDTCYRPRPVTQTWVIILHEMEKKEMGVHDTEESGRRKVCGRRSKSCLKYDKQLHTSGADQSRLTQQTLAAALFHTSSVSADNRRERPAKREKVMLV